MNAVRVHPRSSFAEICGHLRPFAFEKGIHADGRRFPRIDADQSQVSAKICGHPRSSAFSKLFNANGRKWPRIFANHGFKRIEEMEMNTQGTVNVPDSFAEFYGHSRPFAFEKEFHADGRRSARIDADQSQVSAKICVHPRSSAFSKLFSANGRKWPRISANHGFKRIEEMGMNTQDTVNVPDSFASICGHLRPFAFEKEFHADGRRFPRIDADQSDVSAKICGHPRLSAFSNSFNANSREYPQIAANQDR